MGIRGLSFRGLILDDLPDAIVPFHRVAPGGTVSEIPQGSKACPDCGVLMCGYHVRCWDCYHKLLLTKKMWTQVMLDTNGCGDDFCPYCQKNPRKIPVPGPASWMTEVPCKNCMGFLPYKRLSTDPDDVEKMLSSLALDISDFGTRSPK